MSRSKNDFEFALSEIVGKKLKRVRYVELQCEQSEPYYFIESFQGHSLDYGCDLEMDDGETFGFIWDGEFYQYGVGVFRSSITEKLQNPRVWEATEDTNWLPLVGREVVSARVHWNWVRHNEDMKTFEYPQEIELTFGNGTSVFIAASQYMNESNSLFGVSDNIVVIFGQLSASKYKVGPYALAANNSLQARRP